MIRPESGQLALIACILEATARKPGNVHRFRDFDGAHYLDFVISAAAIGEHLRGDRVRELGVGRVVLDAIRATRTLVGHNTNLGMVLLLAPMVGVPEGEGLRDGLRRVLRGLTVGDARAVYEAIRLAKPGGLGTASDQDVSGEPTVTLLEAMRLAADRDAVASQYAGDYAEVFDIGLPALGGALARGRSLETSIVACHLALMARCPDSLIARKLGAEAARESARLAEAVLSSGWPDAPGSSDRLVEFDAWLRADGHRRNPGTTADLVCASLYAALREGVVALPLAWEASASSEALPDHLGS